jgi:hypothetical protein
VAGLRRRRRRGGVLPLLPLDRGSLTFAPITRFGFPPRTGFEAYARWDGAWYHLIATRGYFYDGPGKQSAVAFFPAYPTAMRGLGNVLGDTMVAGVVVTLAATAVAAVLLHQWASDRFDGRVATLLVVLLVCSPYAYYLLGVLYSDALFLATTVAAFLLLERRHPWLSAGAAALADRRPARRPGGHGRPAAPVPRARRGPAHEVEPGRRPSPAPLLRPVEGPALHAGTRRQHRRLVGYCTYLWVRFDEPFAFVRTGDAPGWGRDFSLRTIAKLNWVDIVTSGRIGIQLITTTISGILTVAAIALLPRILRRLGRATSCTPPSSCCCRR